MKQRFATYVLQNLHGQLSGNNVLILCLKIFNELLVLISLGTWAQILGPRKEIVSLLQVYTPDIVGSSFTYGIIKIVR